MGISLEVSEKLKHLSVEEIRELCREYDAGEKVSALIERFKINVNPSSLWRELPPVETDIACPYCKTPMYSRRPSRSGMSYHPAECALCEHKTYPEKDFRRRTCDCAPCISAKKEEKRKEEETRVKVIQERYDLDRTAPAPYSKLGLFHKAILLALTNEDSDSVYSIHDTVDGSPLMPTEKMGRESLEELHSISAITIDPMSENSAFDEKGEAIIGKGRWLVNVTLDGAVRSSASELICAIKGDLTEGFAVAGEAELQRVMFKIATEEVLSEIYRLCGKYRLPFTAEDSTREVVRNLLRRFSVSEINYFAFLAVRNAHDLYEQHANISKPHAANCIPGKMTTSAGRAKKENWNITKQARTPDAKQSVVSKLFYSTIWNPEIDVFFTPLSEVWARELRAARQTVKSYGVCCLKCSSESVEIAMVEGEIEIYCLDCGTVSYFVPK